LEDFNMRIFLAILCILLVSLIVPGTASACHPAVGLAFSAGGYGGGCGQQLQQLPVGYGSFGFGGLGYAAPPVTFVPRFGGFNAGFNNVGLFGVAPVVSPFVGVNVGVGVGVRHRALVPRRQVIRQRTIIR
jgi:hypothetical protein